MFPRADAVIIGGSVEDHFTTPDPDPAFCKGLVDHMASLFGEGPPVPMSERHIDHPGNVPNIAAKQAASV